MKRIANSKLVKLVGLASCAFVFLLLLLNSPSGKSYKTHSPYEEYITQNYKQSQFKYKYVITIASVMRKGENYVSETVKKVFQNMPAGLRNSSLVILHNAEMNPKDHTIINEEIKVNYQDANLRVIDRMTDVGLYNLIYSRFYDPNYKLHNKHSEPEKSLYWKSKQVLDLLYLLSIAQSEAKYILMLQDDIYAFPNYLAKIDDFVHKYETTKRDWFILKFFSFKKQEHESVFDLCDFGGTFGLLISPLDRHFQQLLLYMFRNFDMDPDDWLIRDFMIDHRLKMISYSPSLFEHKGTHSSLIGKTIDVQGVAIDS